MANYYYKGDLPASLVLEGDIAIDTEAMGLQNLRDRLCLVQISTGDGNAHLVHFPNKEYDAAVNLKKILSDPKRVKLFHFARFDVAILHQYLGVNFENIYCTKIASKLVRTYTDKHGLKDLCQELVGVNLSKVQRSSDWGKEDLDGEQINYAAADVLYLHRIRDQLNIMLKREGREHLAQCCFDFIPCRALLDLKGWIGGDIFEH